MRRPLTTAVGAVALAALLAACGDAGGAASEDASSEATSQVTAPSDAQTDADLDEPSDVGSEAAEPAEPEPATEAPEGPPFLALTAYGFDSSEGVIEFGHDADATLDILTGFYGEPIFDGGWVEPFEGGCVGVGADEVRNVSWEATNVLFLDGAEAEAVGPHFAYWLTGDADQVVQSFVGDATEIGIFPGATTVADLRDSYNDEDLQVVDDEPLGPYFYVNDNWGELRGELTDTSDDAFVQSVNAGVICGE